jgi:hypothetical protein
MTTMNVMITHHTEEDLWAHMCRMETLLEKRGDYYSSAWSKFSGDVIFDNPYAKYSVMDWRLHKVKKITENKWREDWTAEELELFTTLLSINGDYELCDKAFDWSSNKAGFCSMKYEAEKFCLCFDKTDFKLYSDMRHDVAYKKYQTQDAEYINEKIMKNSHDESHISGDSPAQKLSAWAYENDAEYKTRIIEAKKTCKYCIEDTERKKRQEDYEIAYEIAMKEQNIKWAREQEEKRKQQEAQMRRPSRMHSCEDCDYHTTSIGAYDDHMDSREHKAVENRKKWFCKDCGIQSRSVSEHEFHIRSKKHLKAIGELEEEEKEIVKHECKSCSYSTPYKQVYQTHLKSAKHLKNTTA